MCQGKVVPTFCLDVCDEGRRCKRQNNAGSQRRGGEAASACVHFASHPGQTIAVWFAAAGLSRHSSGGTKPSFCADFDRVRHLSFLSALALPLGEGEDKAAE